MIFFSADGKCRRVKSMKIFDSHCHLDDPAFDRDRQGVIERAHTAGVIRLMTIGVTPETSARAVRLADEYAEVYASVGIHPHDAKACSPAALDQLVELARNPKVCAWGEIGLDFARMYSPQPQQEQWFIKQLELAAGLALPLIFHERDSKGRFLQILKSHGPPSPKGVVHCFSGTEKELMQYLELGLYIGVTGIVTLQSRGAQLRRLAGLVPAERLLVETDAPYLTPAPEKNRTRRNEPAFVKSVLLKLAAVRKEDPRQLADTIWNNTCRLYGLQP